MKKILIVGQADILPEPPDMYAVTRCSRAEEAAALLPQGFDGMILELFLPGTDGLALLESAADVLPPVILALSRFLSPYVLLAAAEAGVGYLLPIPCTQAEILRRLEDMLLTVETPVSDTAAAFARYHVRRLGLPRGKGLSRILEILPHYDSRTEPCLSKDFYADMAKALGVSTDAIDAAIHRSIQKGYEHRNDAIWREYFADTSECPGNKEFFNAVSDRIHENAPSR